MRIGVYQMEPRFGEVEGNVSRAVEDLSRVEADLIVLPELFSTGYQFLSRQEVRDLAEEIPSGRTCSALQDLASSKKMSLIFGIAEKDGSFCYNSAAVIGPAGFLGTYRKVHLFAEEKDVFSPGNTGFQVFDLGSVRVGVMICFDWLFPESARVLTLLGADLICHPANLVLPHCQGAMVTRCIENGVFSATANRIGTESRGGKSPLTFTGRSQVLDQVGRVLTRLGETETGISVVEADLMQARNKRITDWNDRMADRRPECYERITSPTGVQDSRKCSKPGRSNTGC